MQMVRQPISQPVTAVWEITMACNMHCRHCGSSCMAALPDELNTEEALQLCDSLGDMGFSWITLSGGEPTIRNDWHLIASALTKNGIIPNLITNGWNFDEDILNLARDAGVNTIAFSLDGLEQTHDNIRRNGSFRRILHALSILKGSDTVKAAIITTINRRNIGELDQLKNRLAGMNISSWQLQIALPMGNMKEIDHLVIGPEQIREITDFASRAQDTSPISIQLADCIGYHDAIEMKVRCQNTNDGRYPWQGCPAGRYSMGILHNGDILGCTSIRDSSFIEGNIREKPIAAIWNDPGAFSWNRARSIGQLAGLCRDCPHAATCLGGCSNSRLTLGGSIQSENTYCLYNMSVQAVLKQQASLPDRTERINVARCWAQNGNCQIALRLIEDLLEDNPQDCAALRLSGYLQFMMGHYREAARANQIVLQHHPQDAYASKGLGLSLYRLGKVRQGVYHLTRAIQFADEGFLDPYYDLALVLYESNQIEMARKVLQKARDQSITFTNQSQALFDRLKDKQG